MEELNYKALLDVVDKNAKSPTLNLAYVKTLYNSETETLEKIYAMLQNIPLAEVMECTLIAGVAEFNGHLDLILELLLKDFAFLKDISKLSVQEILQRTKKVITTQSAGMFEGFYTEKHEPRNKDPYYENFEQTKRLINQQLDPGCYICGITNADLESYRKVNKKPLLVPLENEDLLLELHHYFIEFSYLNSLDLDLFNEKLLPIVNQTNYLKNYFMQNPLDYDKVKDNPLIKELAATNYTMAPLKNDQELYKFIVSGPLNMMPLCTVHHRSFHSGIHQVVYPFWLVQKVLKREDLIKQRFYDYSLKHLLVINSQTPVVK